MQRDWALRADIWALQTAAHTQTVTPQCTVFQQSLIRKVDLCVRVRVFVAKLWGDFFSSSSKRGHGERTEQNEQNPIEYGWNNSSIL